MGRGLRKKDAQDTNNQVDVKVRFPLIIFSNLSQTSAGNRYHRLLT